MSVSHITDNFTWAEAACHSGAEVPLELQPNARRLAQTLLEPLRARFGGPLIPISWYRTPEYNHRIHGAPLSQHMYACAADIRPVEMAALARLVSLAEEMLAAGDLPTLGGLGIYDGWIHVDVRAKPPSGHVARWVGKGVGSEA